MGRYWRAGMRSNKHVSDVQEMLKEWDFSKNDGVSPYETAIRTLPAVDGSGVAARGGGPRGGGRQGAAGLGGRAGKLHHIIARLGRAAHIAPTGKYWPVIMTWLRKDLTWFLNGTPKKTQGCRLQMFL